MKVQYNEGLEHCIEIYDDESDIMISVEEAEELVNGLKDAILEAKNKEVRTFVKPYQPF